MHASHRLRPWHRQTAAGLWAALGANGKLIGPYDMPIAATALERGHSLATLNLDEFDRVDGLDLLDVTPNTGDFWKTKRPSVVRLETL